MAFTQNPSTWIGGWSVSGTAPTQTVGFSLSAVPELTATEAAGSSSGDIRKCWFALNEKMFQEYTVKSPADIPNRMAIFKSVSVNTATGISTVSYTTTFQIQTTGQEVQDEPVA